MTPHAARSDWTIARARFGRWIAGVFCAAGLLGAAITHALGAPSLRVCADPDNMPFSNDKGEGFENKLAALVAEQLGRKLDYSWFAEKTGYVPNTMGKDACDLVMGYAQGTGLIEDTNPYYYASYVLITRADAAELMGVASLSDPRLRTKRIGFFARTPPASILAMQGLLGAAKSFETRSGDSQSKAAEAMIGEIASGTLDAGILWGPVGGYYASRAGVPLTVVPLVKESTGPVTFYGITMGVRPNEPQFKHEINKVLAENADEIATILQEYDVPVLDQEGGIVAPGKSGAGQ